MKNKVLYILVSIYKDSLIKNSIYLMMTNFSTLVIGFLFWVIAAKYYATSDIGLISAALSSILLISTISTIGLPTALTFYLPMYPKYANRVINSSIITGIIVSATVASISILGIEIWAPELKSVLGSPKLAIIFIVTTVMTTLSFLMTGIFTAGKRSSFHMIRENAFAIIRIFLIILLANFGAIGIFLTWSIGLIISIIIGFFLMFKLWNYIPTIDFDPIIKKMANFSLGNHIAGILYNLPRFALPIIVVDLISAEAAGYFFIAMTIASLLYGVPTAISGPFLAESYDKDRFWNNVGKLLKFNIYLLIPGLLLFVIFGKFILNIFSTDYANNAFVTLIILCMASIPQSLIVIFDTIRSAQKRIAITIIINGIVAAITIILSVFLAGIWDIEGIAAAYLIANTLMAMVIVVKMENPIDFTIRSIKVYKDVKIKDKIKKDTTKDDKIKEDKDVIYI